MPFRLSLFLVLLIAMVGCSSAPKIGDGPSDADRAAKYPTLLPLSTLIATHTTPRKSSIQIGGVASLMARAEAARGPVIDPQSRAKLLDAIKRHSAL